MLQFKQFINSKISRHTNISESGNFNNIKEYIKTNFFSGEVIESALADWN